MSVLVKINSTSSIEKAIPVKVDALEKKLKETNDNKIHEALIGGPAKIYFDFDAKKDVMAHFPSMFLLCEEIDKNWHNDIIKQIIELINEKLKNEFNIENPEWNFCHSSDLKKQIISIHGICNFGFTSHQICGNFINSIKFPEEISKFLDFQVYKSKQSFRTVYSVKDDGTRQLIPMTSGNLDQFLISTIKTENIIKTDKYNKQDKPVFSFTEEVNDNINYEEIKELLQIYPEKYYSERDHWIKIGFSLGNLSKSDKMKELFVNFSKQWSKFSENEEFHTSSAILVIDGAKSGENSSNWQGRLKELKKINPERFQEIYDKYHSIDYSSLKKEKIKESQNVKIVPSDDYAFNDFKDDYHKKELNTLEDCLIDLKRCLVYTNDEKDTVIMKTPNKYEILPYFEYKRYVSQLYVLIPDGKKQKKVNFAELIVELKKNISYRSYGFYPSDCPEKTFNIFPGFVAKQLESFDENKIGPILFHIKNVLMNKNDLHYNWFLDWLAFIVQNPGTKSRKAPIIYSQKHQVGKGIFGSFLTKKIFGKILCGVTSNLKDMAGDFNSFIERKILVVCEEIKSEDKYRDTYNKLKTLIADEDQEVRKKHKESTGESTYLNMLFFTNERKAINIDVEDRRFEFFEANGEYQGNTEYYENLKKCFDSCGDEFYTFLMKRETSAEKVRIKLKNDFTDKIKESSIDKELLFIKELLTEEIELSFEKSNDFYDCIKPQDLYNCYVSWCSDSGTIKKAKKNFLDDFRNIMKNIKEMKKTFGSSRVNIFIYNKEQWKKDLIDYCPYIRINEENTQQ